METQHVTQEAETKLDNFHYIEAPDLERAYRNLLQNNNMKAVRKSLAEGNAGIFYDIDGVVTDWKIRDVLLLSLYRSRLTTMKSIIRTFPNAAHIVYTSRPQSSNRIRNWIQPLKETLSILPRSSPRLVEVIDFTPENLREAKDTLAGVVKRPENVLAIITDLAKEGSMKFISTILKNRTNETRDEDMLTPLFETVGEEFSTLVVLDNDDTILEQIQTFAKNHTEIQVYYISITTNSYIAKIRNLKQRIERGRNAHKG